MVVQYKVHGRRLAVWNCIGKNGGDLMVSHPGNVSIPEFSYVWRYRFCGSHSNDVSVADKKISDKNDLWRTDTTL